MRSETDRIKLEAFMSALGDRVFGLIETGRLLELFAQIEPQLIRYPAIDPASFRAAVTAFCHEPR